MKRLFTKRKKCPKCRKITMEPIYWAGPSRIPKVLLYYQCRLCAEKLIPDYTTRKMGSIFVVSVKLITEAEYLKKMYASCI